MSSPASGRAEARRIRVYASRSAIRAGRSIPYSGSAQIGMTAQASCEHLLRWSIHGQQASSSDSSCRRVRRRDDQPQFLRQCRQGCARTLAGRGIRAFADVFSAIKQGYVEPVEDKKLITDAINGMLSGRPALGLSGCRSLQGAQVGTQGEFGGLGIEVGMEDGFVKVVSPIEDTPAFRAGVNRRSDRQAR